MISLLGSVLEVIEKFRPFARRSVSISVNYLEDILITNFFLSVTLVIALSVQPYCDDNEEKIVNR